MKLSLNNYKTIVFDLDGVITSELAYWNSAALCAFDLLASYEHYGNSGLDREWLRRQYNEVYNTVMCGGRTVKAAKRLGINTNFDLAYIVFCVSKYIDPEISSLDSQHFQSVCMFIENITLSPPKLYDALSELCSQSDKSFDEHYFDRSGKFFREELLTCFDLWYGGCDEFNGISETEKLLFDDADLERMLKKLQSKGITLGIGSGRPSEEIVFPLSKSGIYKYFDKNCEVSFDTVLNAEKELNLTYSLAKPEPFVFLKSVLGKDYSNRRIVDGDYPADVLKNILVVGDAPCDMLAAKKAGFDFLAVLTGAEGESIRGYFEENGADYIFNNVLELENCEE